MSDKCASRVHCCHIHSMERASSRATFLSMPSIFVTGCACGMSPVPTALSTMAEIPELAAQSLDTKSSVRRCMTMRSCCSPKRPCVCGPCQPAREPRKAPASRLGWETRLPTEIFFQLLMRIIVSPKPYGFAWRIRFQAHAAHAQDNQSARGFPIGLDV